MIFKSAETPWVRIGPIAEYICRLLDQLFYLWLCCLVEWKILDIVQHVATLNINGVRKRFPQGALDAIYALPNSAWFICQAVCSDSKNVPHEISHNQFKGASNTIKILKIIKKDRGKSNWNYLNFPKVQKNLNGINLYIF